jgi:hypothetical protein
MPGGVVQGSLVHSAITNGGCSGAMTDRGNGESPALRSCRQGGIPLSCSSSSGAGKNVFLAGDVLAHSVF